MHAPQRSVEGSGWLTGPRVYVLTMLTLIYVLNMVDRKIVTIIQEPIKAEFGLADWQLGLMTGFGQHGHKQQQHGLAAQQWQ